MKNEDDWKEFIAQHFNNDNNFEYNNRVVQDALFGEANVYGERINIIFDSASKGCAITKQFLDRKGQNIDQAASIKLIDIHGKRTTPLGEKLNVPINIEGTTTFVNLVVTESKDYNIILGNEWLSKMRAKFDYGNGLLTIVTDQGEVATPVTCWDYIRDPTKFYAIPTISNENQQEELELELEDEDESESQPLFVNLQESPGGIHINERTYSRPCINYWNEQFKNPSRTYQGPGRCWCDKKLNDQQSCTICQQRWEDCEVYNLILGDDRMIIPKTSETPSYKVKIEKEDIIINIQGDKNVVIGELNETQKQQMEALLQKYAHLFANKKEELGRTNVVKHAIYTEEVPPIRQKFYRTSQKEQEHIDQEIQEMLYHKIIRPSTNSEWASPVILVPKKNGKLRFCVDYRQLNRITKKDNYPLPRIDEILDSLGKAKWFTSLDLASGYWQVEMREEDKSKTAFISRNGTYKFNVMPFGLCNAPGTFQRCMDTVLRDILWKYALVYLDDVTAFSQTFEEHLQHLETIFKRIEAAGLKINPDKCHFGAHSLQFLGHIISDQGILPDPTKIEAVKNYPQPQNLTQLRAFLGLASYYRRFIKDFSKISSPLYELLKKDIPYEWIEQRQQAFQLLKEKLISAPLLMYPDFTKPFCLYTDASYTALGAVIEQLGDDGLKHPIAYASRTTSSAERKYSSTELECAAVVWAVNYFRPYLYGKRFTIFTDHSALQWLLKLKTIKNGLTGRLARWQLQLQSFDYDIKYRPGTVNSNADALSRMPQQLNQNQQ